MDNIHIRPLRETDASTSFKWRNDPEVWLYTETKPDIEITQEIEKEWIKKVISDPTSRRFAIIANDIYVGNVYLTDIKSHIAEYHIFIGDKEYWGKGIAKKASEQIIEFGRKKLQLEAIELGVREDNGAAFHLYEKLGFKIIGKNGIFTRMRLELKD